MVCRYFRKSEEYIIANLAIFKAGGAIFLLETNYTKELLSELIVAGGIKTILTTSDMVAGLPEKYQGPEFSHRLDGDWMDRLRDTDAAGRLPNLVDPGVTPTSLGYITMTSGSTGKPKAILNDHHAAVMCYLARFKMYPYRPGEREGLNVFFAWECLRAVIDGSIAVVIPDDVIFDPPRLLRLIKQRQITRLMVTPSLLKTILDFPGLDHQTLMGEWRAV